MFSRSSGDSQTTYSLGAYVRESDWTVCSSISLASLRAISTGRTSDLKARLNVPSTRPASFCSRLRSTLTRVVSYPRPREVSLVSRAVRPHRPFQRQGQGAAEERPENGRVGRAGSCRGGDRRGRGGERDRPRRGARDVERQPPP